MLEIPTTEEDSRSEKEEITPAPTKRGLKSGKIRTADTTVLHQINGPHEVVYTSTGELEEYEVMSVTLFVCDFLVAMAREKETDMPFMLQHQQELMEDVKLYS